jgi:hypothetical protein
MKSSNLTLGVILVIAGALLLLNNFDLLHINIREMVKFWPLLLVYSGMILLAGDKKGWGIPMAMILITALSILVYLFFNQTHVGLSL